MVVTPIHMIKGVRMVPTVLSDDKRLQPKEGYCETTWKQCPECYIMDSVHKGANWVLMIKLLEWIILSFITLY